MFANDSAAYAKYLQQFPGGLYSDSAKKIFDSIASNNKDAEAEKSKLPANRKVVDNSNLDKLKLGKTLAGVKENFGEPDYDLSREKETDWIYNLGNMDLEIISYDQKSIDVITFNISADSKDTLLLYPEYYNGYNMGSAFAQSNQGEPDYYDSIYWVVLSRDSYVYYTNCESVGGGTVLCAIIGSRDYNNLTFPNDPLHMGPDGLKDVYKNVAKAKKTYITLFYDFDEEFIRKVDQGGINASYRKH